MVSCEKNYNTEEFWRGLTPEKAFLVRVFVDHCVSTKENACLEKVLPVVTAHSFRIQDTYNSLLDFQTAAEKAGGDDEVGVLHRWCE
jgi:condensin complex subunit 3